MVTQLTECSDSDEPSEKIDDGRKNKRGALKIFFGYAAGAGKTYAMLDDAREQLRRGADVLVGYVEPHARPETLRLLHGLPVLPPQKIKHRNIESEELDLDEALKRKPELILVDGLAHTNVNGMRNRKRYQDIEELLNAGIDVGTTANVQDIESLNDVVQSITKLAVRETVPDYIFDGAERVKLIDIDPEELLNRLEEGGAYNPERAGTALREFFTREKLRLLREIAMRRAADWISRGNENEGRVSGKTANIKFLACIGASPASARCIRWTARTAEAFHAPWAAVYVQDMEGERLSEEQNKTVRANMDLAERLGAEIVTLGGQDIAAVVAEYAKLSGITDIVVGKSRNKKTLLNLFDMDFEDKLMTHLPNIEIHIIPSITTRRIYRKHMRPAWNKNLYFSWPGIIKTAGLLTAATLISLTLSALEGGEQNVIMVYILAVLITSRVTWGYAYGIAAAVLSVFVFDFFFTTPYFTFTALTGYPLTFVIMLLAALITSALTVGIKTQVRLAVERERRTEVLYEINKRLLSTRGLENIVALTNEYIVKLFGRSVIFYSADPAEGTGDSVRLVPGDADARLLRSENEKAAAHWVFVNRKNAGAGTDTMMEASAFYMPVTSQSRVLGVLGISCIKSRLEHSQRLFLRMIASQVAMALERQYLSDEQRRILVESEKEKMRSNLLRAISHDLRTPLTGILGASSAILESGDSFDKPTRDKLIRNIKEDSQWLIRLVENLLSVTRIHDGTMKVKKMPEAVEEIVAEAISRIRKRFPGRGISVKVPEELLMVPMDGTLIVQVLINLLENAVKHSPEGSPIEVEVRETGKTAVFEVRDNGEGLDRRNIPYLFDGYASDKKRSSDSSRGMGIGLSICRSIIKAHYGKLEAANRKTGGAAFWFSLPLERGVINEQ